MAETNRELTFVVAGEPPSAVAVAADRVRAIVALTSFAGAPLDLRPLSSGAAAEDATHVLVVQRGDDELGLCVSGRLKLLTLGASAVLPLPDVVGRRAGLSHLLAPRGVPLMFVLDLARLETPGNEPWPQCAATEA